MVILKNLENLEGEGEFYNETFIGPSVPADAYRPTFDYLLKCEACGQLSFETGNSPGQRHQFGGDALEPPRLRQSNSTLAASDWTVLHRDAQPTIRAVTTSTGTRAERFDYRPYGAQISSWTGVVTGKQSKGWTPERFDAEAGLQYLNAPNPGPHPRSHRHRQIPDNR